MCVFLQSLSYNFVSALQLEHLNMDRKPVISVGANATLLDALKVMQKHSISSVPIVESNHIIMVLSMSDLKVLLRFSLSHTLLDSLLSDLSHSVSSNTTFSAICRGPVKNTNRKSCELRFLKTTSQMYARIPLAVGFRTVRSSNSRSLMQDQAPYFGVSPTSSLESVVGKMVATRAHRVFVVESHKPVGIVSLSDVISCVTSS